MVNVRYLRTLARTYATQGNGRRALAELAAKVGVMAKQSIFAAQRGEVASARRQLKEAENIIKQGQRVFRQVEELGTVGSWRAALEEYAEASLFVGYLEHGKVGQITGVAVSVETYLGGLSDFVGELARYAIKLATARRAAEVDRLVEVGTVIVGELAAMNLTGSLRSKFDQAKQHLRKLEDIRYDLSLRSDAR